MASSKTSQSDKVEFPALKRVLEEINETVDNSTQRAFATRAVRAITEMTRRLNTDLISEATSSPSDIEVLVNALSELSEQASEETDSAFLKAKLRAIKSKRRLLEAEGGTGSSSDIAELLGISRQAISKRRRNNQLLGLKTTGRDYRYPLWQVSEGETLNGLETILEALSDKDSWMTLQFFLRENARLDDKRPLDVLRDDSPERLDQVLSAAESYGDQGAD